MSKGYPDYFGFSMFPNYGQIEHSNSLTASALGNYTSEILNISGKAITQGGYLKITDCVLPTYVELILIIDSTYAVSVYINDLFNDSIMNENILPIYISKYNLPDEYFIISFRSLIPFQKHFKLYIDNHSAYDLTIYSDFLYSLIIS